MTSNENHDETVNFITKQNDCFGLQEENFIFFPQAMLPALSDKGKILMQSASELKLSPNGNGGFYDTLVKNDQVNAHIKAMEYVQIIGVDNILNKILDPVQIGFTSLTHSDVTLKACNKRDYSEKVGVVAKKNGKYAIVEYSELDLEHAQATLEDGETLQFRHGSILIFMFKASALLALATDKESNTLYHKAQKKVDHYCMETK